MVGQSIDYRDDIEARRAVRAAALDRLAVNVPTERLMVLADAGWTILSATATVETLLAQATDATAYLKVHGLCLTQLNAAIREARRLIEAKPSVEVDHLATQEPPA